MQLTVLERIKLLDILPQQGDIASIRIVRKLREALSFTEQEHELLQIQVIPAENGGSQIKWDEGAEPQDVEIGPRATALIVEALKRLDSAKQLTTEHISLWDKFCSDENR